MNDVVVTGIGLVTPLGIGREKNWGSLINSKSAVSRDRAFREILTARVSELNVPYETRLLSMGFLACAEAYEDSRFDISFYGAGRIGCSVSASKPNIILKDSGIVLPDLQLQTTLALQLSKLFKISGPVSSITAACASGTNSIIKASEWIRHGLCDVAFAGASESPFNDLYMAGFKQMGVLAKNIVAPFSSKREGFAMGEGAAVLVLERKDQAVVRGAEIYGEISGWAMGCDIKNSVAFDSEGRVISELIKRAHARTNFAKIDYINAHGTATKLNDLMETRAIKRAFGSSAKDIAVSSTKAATGHLLGASGSLGLSFALLAMRDSVVPPTLNLIDKDVELNLDFVPNTARHMEVKNAMSLSFGFGGQIGIVAVRK